MDTRPIDLLIVVYNQFPPRNLKVSEFKILGNASLKKQLDNMH